MGSLLVIEIYLKPFAAFRVKQGSKSDTEPDSDFFIGFVNLAGLNPRRQDLARQFEPNQAV